MNIEDILNAIGVDQFQITYHANMSMQGIQVTFNEIVASVQDGEIIEDYPDDTPYPSCLIHGNPRGIGPVHSVWGYNADIRQAILITVLCPISTAGLICVSGGQETVALDKCPRCGFDDVVEKRVEELLRGGNNVAVVTVPAKVCHHCGEQMYSGNTVLGFDKIREKLASQQVDDFQPLGRSFRVRVGYADEWDAERVQRLIERCDSQTEAAAAAAEDATHTVMEIPTVLVPSVRALLSQHHG